MSNAWLVSAITEYLTEFGEGSRSEMAAAIGRPRGTLGAVLTRMRKASPKKPKRVHIVRWSHEGESSAERRYPRPVYALGDKPDAKRPPRSTVAENTNRYYWRQKTRVNSVFSFAQRKSVPAKVSA